MILLMFLLIVSFSILALVIAGVVVGLMRKDRRSFITGSYAYGSSYRTTSSDIDLVLWVDDETLKDLASFTKKISSTAINQYGSTASADRIEAGGVDLILVTRKKDYDHWRRITKQLKKKAKTNDLTRVSVIDTFEKDRKRRKIGGRYGKGRKTGDYAYMLSGPWKDT